LKPDNVLVDSNYIAKVTDFGLSQYKNKNRVQEEGDGYNARKTLRLNKNYLTFIPPEETPTG
jgi:serine/threonine protein kinase